MQSHNSLLNVSPPSLNNSPQKAQNRREYSHSHLELSEQENKVTGNSILPDPVLTSANQTLTGETHSASFPSHILDTRNRDAKNWCPPKTLRIKVRLEPRSLPV